MERDYAGRSEKARRARGGCEEDGGGEKTGKERVVRGKAVERRVGISMLRGMRNPSTTSVNRDRAAAGLQVYRTDNADRSIGFSEMQRRG